MHGEHEPEARFGAETARALAFAALGDLAVSTEGPEHRIVACNAAAIAFFGGVVPIGSTVRDLMVGAGQQTVLDWYDGAFRGESVVAGRSRLVTMTPEGLAEEPLVSFSMWPRHDAAGAVVGVVATARVLTEQAPVDRRARSEPATVVPRRRPVMKVVDELQRALLPSSVPVLPHVDLAASYAVGGDELAAGGDWFDAVAREDGSVVLVVGDVLGHGVPASVLMSQIRAAALARMASGDDIADVVRHLDRFCDVVPAARAASVCVARAQVENVVSYCAAGHPPPLLVEASGESRFLETSGNPGLGLPGARDVVSVPMRRGDLVLLYSDGILDRPGVTAAASTVELAGAAAAAAAHGQSSVTGASRAVERVSGQLIERLTRTTGTRDDIAVIAAQFIDPLRPLAVCVESPTTAVGEARAAIREWLGVGRLASQSAERLDVIVTELVENAVDHAYGGAPGPIYLDAQLDAQGTLHLDVSDAGRWIDRGRARGNGGLGVPMVRQLADTFELTGTPTGTTASVTLRLEGPTTCMTTAGPSGRSEPFDVYEEPADDGRRVTVCGAVDSRTAAALHAQLAICLAPGTTRLVIDLDQVTLLSSIPIQVLVQIRDQAAAAGIPVAVRARPDSAAHHALTVAGIEM